LPVAGTTISFQVETSKDSLKKSAGLSFGFFYPIKFPFPIERKEIRGILQITSQRSFRIHVRKHNGVWRFSIQSYEFWIFPIVDLG